MIEGAFSFAFLNRSLTLDAPTPTNISTKSEPEIEKNGTPASPATAFASIVLPVPGGPTSNAPLGIFAPSFVNFYGVLRKSTNSCTSSLAYSIPATCLNLVLIFLSTPKTYTFDLDIPNISFIPPLPKLEPPFDPDDGVGPFPCNVLYI